MKFRGTWNDPISRDQPEVPSPLFLRLVELDRLKDMVSKAAAMRALAPGQGRERTASAGDSDEEAEDSLGSWLRQLEAEMQVEGFGKMFVCDTDCIALLLKALGVDSKPDPRASSDPQGVSINVFKRLFAQRSRATIVQALEKGVIDRMLLRLGDLQAEEPRRPARPKSFQLGGSEAGPISSSATQNANREAAALSKQVTPAAPQSMAEAESLLVSGVTAANQVSNTLLAPTADSKVLWKPGYGTGEAPASASRTEAERETMRVEKMKRTTALAECLSVYLNSIEELEDPNSAFWKDLLDCLDASCLLRVMMSSFFRVTCKAVVENAALYNALMGLVGSIAKRPLLAGLVGEVPGVYKSLYELMRSMKELAQSDLADEDDETSKGLMKLIENTCALTDAAEAVRLAQIQHAASAASETQGLPKSETIVADDVKAVDDSAADGQLYEEAMRAELFKDLDMRDPSTGKYSSHHFASAIEEDAKETGASKNRQRRLNRELKSLRTTLPLHFGSTIVLRIDRTRPFVGQFIIFAPQETPYDSGAFLFDFFCTAEYPNEPPKVNLQTTGQGRVRFNPNLYQNGKVCLSLLGTWRGGATGTENWSAENSSLYQVLVSIQSAILGSEFPYFNEPTVEALWGTEEGELQKRIHPNGGYEKLRVATIQYAMTAQIRCPPFGFETCIRSHFLYKRKYILSVCAKWIREGESSNTVGHLQALKEAVEDLTVALNELGPTPQEAVLSSQTLSNSSMSVTEQQQNKATPSVAEEESKQQDEAILNTVGANESGGSVQATTGHVPGKKPTVNVDLSMLPPAVRAGMLEQILFMKEMYPEFPDEVFKQVFMNTVKRDANGEVIATDFMAAMDELTKLTK